MLGLAQTYFIISLLVPMLVPAGMMLARDSESNIIELSICSATNPRTVLFDLETGALVDPDPHLASTDSALVVNPILDSAPAVEKDHHPVSGDDICPFDLATSDQLSIAGTPEGEPSFPNTAIIQSTREFLPALSEHPSSPPRGPPIV